MKEQIIIGSLLGDASISKKNGKKEYCSIRWEHSLSQKEYAIWKANNSLDNYSIYERNRFDKRTNKEYKSITCYSVKDNYKYYRELFYNNKKEITSEILDIVQPLAIAVWYMDDGCMYYNGNNCHLTLAVNGFTDNEVNLIIEWFKLKFEINFKKHNKAIRLTSKREVKKFMQLIEKFIPNCMNYKKLSEAELKHELTLNPTQLKMRKSKIKMYEER